MPAPPPTMLLRCAGAASAQPAAGAAAMAAQSVAGAAAEAAQSVAGSCHPCQPLLLPVPAEASSQDWDDHDASAGTHCQACHDIPCGGEWAWRAAELRG